MVNIDQAAFEDALKKCSLEQMYEAYKDCKQLLEVIGRVKSLVTPDDILNNKAMARKKMRMTLKFNLQVRKLPPSYSQMVQSQLRALGGVRITVAQNSKHCLILGLCGESYNWQTFVDRSHRCAIKIVQSACAAHYLTQH